MLDLKRQLTPSHIMGDAWDAAKNKGADMAEDAVFFNEPGLLFITAQKYGAVKKSDVTRVAAEYLTENKRSVITVLPKAKPASSPTDSK